jgi:hypothetical protein
MNYIDDPPRLKGHAAGKTGRMSTIVIRRR